MRGSPSQTIIPDWVKSCFTEAEVQELTRGGALVDWDNSYFSFDGRSFYARRAGVNPVCNYDVELDFDEKRSWFKKRIPELQRYLLRDCDEATMLAHLRFLAEPARKTYPHVRVEIAWDEGDGNIVHGKLFPITEAGLAEAVRVATRVNNECGSNVYVGMMLKSPEAKENRRSKEWDCRVGTAVPVDVDKDAEATHAAIAQIGNPQLVVTVRRRMI